MKMQEISPQIPIWTKEATPMHLRQRKSNPNLEFQLNRNENAGNKPPNPNLNQEGLILRKQLKFISGNLNPTVISSFSSIGMKMQEISPQTPI